MPHYTIKSLIIFSFANSSILHTPNYLIAIILGRMKWVRTVTIISEAVDPLFFS